ncbi:hypothetical protein RHMOL_Rhmol09G0105700 [Rhododendron molle]|uniref:Uncharacterized protein n=1 Tax=Rhododendron molle TaxID=49168 RepID=A0ACC0MBX3_RHOML|nr:hypothetical protein RHMOL_Rhmol09G0105700 [Rhododendron molle]
MRRRWRTRPAARSRWRGCPAYTGARPLRDGEPRAVGASVQTLDPSMAVEGSVVTGSGSGDADHDGDGHAPEAEPRTTEEARAVGPSVESVGLSIVARGSPVVGRSSGSVSGSGAEGGDVEAIGLR